MSGLCAGKCRGERGAMDSPAVVVKTTHGTRALWCPCCRTPLSLAPVDFTTGAPNVNRSLVKTREQRFEDTSCGYDVVMLMEFKSA